MEPQNWYVLVCTDTSSNHIYFYQLHFVQSIPPYSFVAIYFPKKKIHETGPYVCITANKMINMLVSKRKPQEYTPYTSIIRPSMWHSRKDLAWSRSIRLVSLNSLHFLFKTSSPRNTICGLQCSYSRMLNLNRWFSNAWWLCSVTLSPTKYWFCFWQVRTISVLRSSLKSTELSIWLSF